MTATYLLALAFLPSAAPPPGPLPSQLSRWVQELGDDGFEVREAATRKLRDAGESAEAALLKALDSEDAEVVRRARAILKDFRWGIFPGTPKPVVELIGKYQASTRGEKREIIRKLLALGLPGSRALIRIARAEEDPLVRKEVFIDLGASLSRGIGPMLEAGEDSALEALLEVALAGDISSGAANYAAYSALTGKLPARIAEWEDRARKAVVPKTEKEVLAYLYRAAGQMDQAIAAARFAERSDLVEALLYESARWVDLQRNPDFPQTTDPITYTGFRAAYCRLARAAKQYQIAIDDLMKQGRAVAENKGDVKPQAKALFLNGRADLAIELLQKSESNPKMLFEVLSNQTRIKEALSLVESTRKSSSPYADQLEILEARTLHTLGEKEKALATLKRYHGLIKPGPDASWYMDLVESELTVGRREEAFLAAAKILAASTTPGWVDRLFDKLMDPRADDGKVLWDLLRKVEASESTEASMRKLLSFLDGKTPEKERIAFLEASQKLIPSLPGPRAAEARRILGEICLLAKDTEKARKFFQESQSLRGYLRLGDLYAEKKQWDRAAASYLQGYKLSLDPNFPIPEEPEGLPCLALWLSGDALEKSGKLAEGSRLKQRAHLLPLGDGEMRYDFSRALRRRDHPSGSQKEQENLRRFGEPLLSEPSSYYTGEGLRGLAIDRAAKKDWLGAADCYEQTFLRCLQASMNFARPAAYITVPAHIGALRSRGLLASSRKEEALVEIERTRMNQPSGLELVLSVVPEMEKAGLAKEADQLFSSVARVFEDLVATYPRCAWAHNQIAWMGACCRRDLNKSLASARKAVELAGDTAGYHDTLAEVLFQMGKKGEAVAAEKQAVRLNPQREYFQKQLRRMEAGDPKAERPDEDD